MQCLAEIGRLEKTGLLREHNEWVTVLIDISSSAEKNVLFFLRFLGLETLQACLDFECHQ